MTKLLRPIYITNKVYSSLFVSGSGPGVLYGLSKIHKSDFFTRFQFRLIFASYSTPSFNLAKFLVRLLNPFTCNDTTVNTYSFVNEITSVPGASNYYMVSFDIENLFTNIPLYETIDICLSYLFIKTGYTLRGCIGKVVASHAAIARSSPAEVALFYTMHVALMGYCP